VRPAGLDDIRAVVAPEEFAALRAEARATSATPEIVDYVLAIVRTTRSLPSVELGASTRAAVHLLAAAKAQARLAGRDFVTPDDVATVARPALRHRLLLRAEAELERFTADDALEAVLHAVPVPR
jgi:MoxR-like ATPase